jgi:hypothetical protein
MDEKFSFMYVHELISCAQININRWKECASGLLASLAYLHSTEAFVNGEEFEMIQRLINRLASFQCVLPSLRADFAALRDLEDFDATSFLFNT